MLSDHEKKSRPRDAGKKKERPLKFEWLDGLKGDRIRVTLTEALLLLRIVHHANKDGESFPSTRRLARDIGNDNLYRVRAALKKLEARGLIETITEGKPGRGRPTVRRLKLPIQTRNELRGARGGPRAEGPGTARQRGPVLNSEGPGTDDFDSSTGPLKKKIKRRRLKQET